MIKVQRCPFCGHDKMEVIKDDYGNGKYVLCPISEDGCGAQGPIGGSDVAAVILWNSFLTLNSFSGKEINIMDLRQLAAKALTDLGYDGLYKDGECACKTDDLFPCGEPSMDGCRPGYLGKCDPATCANGGGCNWHINAKKDAPADSEGK